MQGVLLAPVELSGEASESGAVLFALLPSERAGTSDTATHLEVIRQASADCGTPLDTAVSEQRQRPVLCVADALTLPCLTCSRPCASAVQGKWVGFRSAVAGDRFLQARRRGSNRLVFFSQNVGTWEQWEVVPATADGSNKDGSGPDGIAGEDPEACEWASLALALRSRRLPQFELAVEVVRLGTAVLAPGAPLTARTLLPAGGGQAGAVQEDAKLERRELQRMSGLLVHVSPGQAVPRKVPRWQPVLLKVHQHRLWNVCPRCMRLL
jgi:hypothetical protein